MLNRVTIATFFAVLVGLFAASTATAASPSDRAPVPPPTTYWQDKGFILMAHQGGEWDFPPNTMYAYKQAMALGADMLDMDAYVTADKKLVLTHDLDMYKNSEAPNDAGHQINDLTVDQLKTYDFAYDWSPHDGSSTTPFRGMATGAVPPPNGFTAADFRIPTFDEVLKAFPTTPINIELKSVSGVSIEDTVNAMAADLAANPGHDENVIINSFGQDMLAAMHAARPQHLSFGGSLEGTTAYIQGNPITPTPVAVEPPDQVRITSGADGIPNNADDIWLDSIPTLKPWADHDGYKIFAWGSDHDPTQDTDPFYAKIIAQGADSYNTPSPTTLANYLCTAGIAKPDGTPRCPGQVCPEGQAGIAPDNCVDIPATASKIVLAPVKGSIKAGKTRKIKLKVSATAGLPAKVTVKLKSSNRRVTLPKSVTVMLAPKGTATKTITVKASKKAKGKAKITATSGALKSSATYTVKPACKSGKSSDYLCGKTNHL